ncbi:tRNA dimethylallyltransferase [Friedmanniella endophytica]|uniref:tRNA dimethylallyltransferase n=1 Tax=Microlunatus kandeliicorticis TaxID=1759536 RepID=A0A7W3P6X9_9ACTN|nr:tRNA dimethylallyltransferase [Microlunatus kandeliicorticis]
MIVVLVGPTAVGKSGLAIALAEHLGAGGRPAEIVNADSMLLYRGMDIGTAKPTPAERARVRHHLVDVLDVTETSTVAEFQTLARAAIEDCLTRGVVPVVVGGSALYVRAVVDEFRFPGTDPDVRARLDAELAERGPAALHERLAAVDPGAAAAILPGNGRRIVRALEVIELTGEPFTASLPAHRYALPDVRQLGLDTDRTTLDSRIADRVDRMWADGLVEEVRGLLDRGLREGRTASRALGYAQVLDHLDGRTSEAEARELTVTGTRKFARRQGSWFRRDPRISWLGGPGDDPDTLLDRAADVLAAPGPALAD